VTTDRVRFGEYELDLRGYQLRRSGRVLKLERFPMEVLFLLVERRGEIVSREEIVEKLWDKKPFLDTDSAINTAIRKIRQSLRDDVERPRFVQTVTRRGYRFMAPVIEVANTQIDSGIVQPPILAAVINAEPSAGSETGKRLRIVVAAAVGMLLVALIAYLSLHSPSKLTDKDTIVLADFANTTGDPVFDLTLRQGMAVQLDQSPFLSLISEARIHRVLGLMGQPPDALLTPEIAREICERTASRAVLDGSIASLGSRYVLGLRATNCSTGEILAEEQVQAATKEDVLRAMTQIASKFRTRVGESISTVAKHNTPLAEATTSSLDALKAYSTGLALVSSKGEAAAAPFFRRATEIDAEFAMAYARLGLVYGHTGESALSAESTRKAYNLRNRASDEEKFFITASFDARVTGNIEKAIETCEAWAQAYPREVLPHAFLAGFIYVAPGRYDKAIEEGQKVLALDPDFTVGYNLLAADYVDVDNLPDAEDTIRRAAARELGIVDFIVQRYDIAFIKDDKPAMEREEKLAMGIPGAEDWVVDHKAFALAYTGHLREARTMVQRAVDLTRQADHRERAALFEAGKAVWEAFFGNTSAARQNASTALALSNDREVEYGSALALAISGDSSGSQSLAADLDARFPEDSSVKFSYLPTLQALLALNDGEPKQAIERLRTSIPYEFGSQLSTIHGNFGALYSVYVRGEVRLALHQGIEAAAEFQKILDHRGVVVSDPVGAMAMLQLARADVLGGDKVKGKAAYQKFLALWKDADPEVPVFIQAKAEYALLQAAT
jgi:DNA-binding winged helix-turn-helix (wHTH) protein/tetratricopeptide (TPR) repeat protein